MTLRVDVIESMALVEPLTPGWDELAQACGRPFAAPGWLLAWWRTLAPFGARPAIIAVRDRDGLVGLAPLYARRRPGAVEYRSIGSGSANHNAPLAIPGREPEVAEALAGALAARRPTPAVLCLDQISLGSPWPGLVAASWPGRGASVSTTRVARSPSLELPPGGYDEWLVGKSRNFRQRLGRDARRLAAAGATMSCIEDDPAAFMRTFDAFQRLHGERWGGATGLTSRAARAMVEIAVGLLPSGRLRAHVITAGDEVVSVQYFIAAGACAAYWNGGWNPAWAAFTPAIQGVAAGVRDAAERGETDIDLGEGDQHYKARFASGDRPVAWVRVRPHGARGVAGGVYAVPARLRTFAAAGVARLPEDLRGRIDTVRGRVPRAPDAP